MQYPNSISKLIESFSKLPGIGPKTAERLSFYVANKMNEDDVLGFAKGLVNVKRELTTCPVCGHITDQTPCYICTDGGRDRSILTVVEDAKDVIALEKMKEYKGLYHVLNGVISPINGIGPNDINIKALIERLKDEEIKEVIIATNPTVEGESTSMYIAKLLKDTDIKMSRIARGLPVGAGLEYADEVTLLKALEGRSEIK
ncbi:recombination mediator RecR [Haloplasma contractile]|uniref:Recombination protein RecR n=1 Tax=Haloplasma contractile SSD-17B TaxID=1033810 RepID=F7PSJ0_9MOLU|nr:recombination mediator RecR [Haloplasma contractile]ERJ12619.1 Recombination protein RecR [Haloplasma contractile SSD-17B]